MNNAQFRHLVHDTPNAARQNGTTPTQTRILGGQTPALGSRIRSNIPMTPRSLGGSSHANQFARQLAERNAELNGQPTKKFRSSVAPKGSKLGAGYTDRTQLRVSEDEDEKSVRVKALEEQVKLGQLAPEIFEALREQIIGGDVKDVHLVKGLDYKLLARVRRGEDVLSEPKVDERAPEKSMEKIEFEPEVDVDEEFDKLERKDIQPLVKEERTKKGDLAAPPLPLVGKKRVRDEILKELRASRAKAAEEAKARLPQLGPRFSKVGAKKASFLIEKDSKGRETLITTDVEGNVKRKVKKSKAQDEGKGLLMPDKDLVPLGMDVSNMIPAPVPAPTQEEDEDIFGEVGKDYNPLAALVNENDSDDDNSDASDKGTKPSANKQPEKSPQPISAAEKDAASMPPPPKPAPPKRNYFNEDPSEKDDPASTTESNPLQDPTILAALKKAATIKPLGTSSDPSTMDEEAAKLARRKKMLDNTDRDADDMDLEFGSSRFGDQEDGEDSGKIKLSVWGGEGEEEGGKRGGKKERKRAPKKRNGDVNSAADVLRAMEAKKARI